MDILKFCYNVRDGPEIVFKRTFLRQTIKNMEVGEGLTLVIDCLCSRYTYGIFMITQRIVFFI